MYSVSCSPQGTVPGPFILTGTPGRRFSAGGVFFYNRLNDTSKPRHGEINYPIVNASIGESDYPSRTSFDTVYNEHFTYYGNYCFDCYNSFSILSSLLGFSIASGFLTNQDTKGIHEMVSLASSFLHYSQIS